MNKIKSGLKIVLYPQYFKIIIVQNCECVYEVCKPAASSPSQVMLGCRDIIIEW